MGKYVYIQDKTHGRSIVVRSLRAEPRSCENRFVEDDCVSLVGVAHGAEIEEMVRESVRLVGGFERLELKGKKVLVKPNVVSSAPNPATTNPEVVGAVVRLLYEHGAAKVHVGDMSALATLSTLRNMAACGIRRAAEENGAEAVAFEDHAWVEVALEGTELIKRAYVTEWVYDADVVVNLPVIKTHRSASYSITLKNFIGCTHVTQRPYLVNKARWEELIAEFNSAYVPELNIVDGTVSMIDGGPWEGETAETGLVMASGDRVAADAVGLGIIKSFGRCEKVKAVDVWKQIQISRALELGLGMDRDHIKILASGEENRRFKRLIEEVRVYTGIGIKRRNVG